MPIYSRKTLLLAKKETSYGVDALPSITDDQIEIFDFSITPNVDKIDREPYRPSISPVASIPSKKYTELSFYVELKGDGVDSATGLINEPKVIRLLEACGMKAMTVEYDLDNDGVTDKIEYKVLPTSTDMASLTFYAYLDGILYKVYGARGDVSIKMEANNIGKMEFKFTGLFEKPVDTPFPDIACNTGIIPPIVKNINLVMGGYAPILSNFEVGLNNDIIQREDMNSVEGVGGVDIISRKTGGSLNPDLMLVAEYDVWDKFINNIPQEISATVGTELGNTVKIRIPQAVYNSISLGDRDSIRNIDVGFTAQGCDDEIEITFA